MIVVLDLDYTLLDTRRFKEKLSGVFNMSPEEWAKDYRKFFKEKKINYNPEKHVAILRRQGEKLPLNVEKRIEVFLKNINKFLFRGTEEKVKKLKKNNFLILLTFGNKSWHKRKVENLTIKKYFDKIILVDKNKMSVLKFLKNKKDEILVVNDNAKETKEITKTIKNARVFLIKGPYSKNVRHEFKIHKSINQLKAE